MKKPSIVHCGITLILLLQFRCAKDSSKLSETDSFESNPEIVKRFHFPPSEPHWDIVVPRKFVEDLIGSVALSDCLGMVEKEWSGCSVRLNMCSAIFVKNREVFVYEVYPLQCEQPTPTEFLPWEWLVYKNETDEIAGMPIRRTTDEPLDIKFGRKGQ